jgi:hypothetical protein
VLDQQTGTEKGFDNRVASFLANVLKVRTANAPDALGSMKQGDVNYLRAPEETFLEFVWFALWSGSWMSSAIDARRFGAATPSLKSARDRSKRRVARKLNSFLQRFGSKETEGNDANQEGDASFGRRRVHSGRRPSPPSEAAGRMA